MNNKKTFFSAASITTYAVLNAMIYHWSFWSAFNINIMQFISLNDLLPSIAFSVAAPVVLISIYAFSLKIILNSKILRSLLDINELKGKLILPYSYHESVRKRKTLKSKKKFDIAFFILISLIVVFLLYKNFALNLKILILFSLSISLAKYLINNHEFKKSVGEYAPTITVLLAVMPTIMFLAGNYNAQSIIQGRNTSLVKSESLCNKNVDSKFRYIANVSDKVFAYSVSDKSVCIFKYDSIILIKEESSKITTANPLPENRS